MALPGQYLSSLSKRVNDLDHKLDKKSEKALAQLVKQENKMKSKLVKLDSLKASQVFSGAEEKYNRLKQKLNNPGKLTQYLPYLDTLKTSMKFLEQNKSVLSNVKNLDKQLSGAMDKVKGLEHSFAKAEEVKAFIKERKQYLKEQLKNLPFTGELKKLNKQAYYYAAQVSGYKATLKDKKKMERKAIEMLSKTKTFNEFMRNNSQLAGMFRLPVGGDLSSAASFAGLQTRASVNALIQDRMGSSADAQAMFRQNVQSARSQLYQLKNKVSGYSSGSYENTSSGIEMPDFKVNEQKTKSFLKRLEYGGNVQSQKARMMFPVTSDLGFSVGYKLNSRSVIGLGASYKLGLGSGWNHVKLSHEGVGLRSFVDYKIKGSLFISGGYEQNYRSIFTTLNELRNYSSWQSSGLIGLSKKYKISKKLKGNVQLLWDFLSYRQVPQTQAVLFRVGYRLK
jgi:hypothetical protein